MITPGSKYAYLLPGVKKLKPGEAYGAEKGLQFDCEPSTFQGVLYQVAATRGGDWRVTTCVVGDCVVWAFFKKGDYMKPNLPAYPIIKKMRGE